MKYYIIKRKPDAGFITWVSNHIFTYDFAVDRDVFRVPDYWFPYLKDHFYIVNISITELSVDEKLKAIISNTP